MKKGNAKAKKKLFLSFPFLHPLCLSLPLSFSLVARPPPFSKSHLVLISIRLETGDKRSPRVGHFPVKKSATPSLGGIPVESLERKRREREKESPERPAGPSRERERKQAPLCLLLLTLFFFFFLQRLLILSSSPSLSLPPSFSTMHVQKRDGRKEAVHFDKITARITKLAYGLSAEFCDPVRERSFFSFFFFEMLAAVFQCSTTTPLNDDGRPPRVFPPTAPPKLPLVPLERHERALLCDPNETKEAFEGPQMPHSRSRKKVSLQTPPLLSSPPPPRQSTNEKSKKNQRRFSSPKRSPRASTRASPRPSSMSWPRRPPRR